MKDLQRYLLTLMLFAPSVLDANASGSENNVAKHILGIDADVEFGEYLASECVACHNPNAANDSAVPVIHGVKALMLVEKLIAYREGSLENTTMQSVAKNLTNEEIAALAAYLSGL